MLVWLQRPPEHLLALKRGASLHERAEHIDPQLSHAWQWLGRQLCARADHPRPDYRRMRWRGPSRLEALVTLDLQADEVLPFCGERWYCALMRRPLPHSTEEEAMLEHLRLQATSSASQNIWQAALERSWEAIFDLDRPASPNYWSPPDERPILAAFWQVRPEQIIHSTLYAIRPPT